MSNIPENQKFFPKNFLKNVLQQSLHRSLKEKKKEKKKYFYREVAGVGGKKAKEEIESTQDDVRDKDKTYLLTELEQKIALHVPCWRELPLFYTREFLNPTNITSPATCPTKSPPETIQPSTCTSTIRSHLRLLTEPRLFPSPNPHFQTAKTRLYRHFFAGVRSTAFD